MTSGNRSSRQVLVAALVEKSAFEQALIDGDPCEKHGRRALEQQALNASILLRNSRRHVPRPRDYDVRLLQLVANGFAKLACRSEHDVRSRQKRTFTV